jgi:hypothetical protein
MLMDVREYIDRLKIDGHTIGEDHDDDPILIDPAGLAVDTWREIHPYDRCAGWAIPVWSVRVVLCPALSRGFANAYF